MSNLRFLTHFCNTNLIQDKQILHILVQNQDLTINLLKKIFDNCHIKDMSLSDETNHEILASIVQHRSSTTELIQNIYDMFEKRLAIPECVLSAITQNAKTSTTILDNESKNRDPYVRKKVAANLSTPQYVLNWLMRDSYTDVVIEAILNPNTNPAVIKAVMDEGIEDPISFAYADQVLRETETIRHCLTHNPYEKVLDQVNRIDTY